MTFPGAEVMKAGAMGEEDLRRDLDEDESFEWPLMPLTRVVPFMLVSTRWTMTRR
jgi:hypothetical protein